MNSSDETPIAPINPHGSRGAHLLALLDPLAVRAFQANNQVVPSAPFPNAVWSDRINSNETVLPAGVPDERLAPEVLDILVPLRGEDYPNFNQPIGRLIDRFTISEILACSGSQNDCGPPTSEAILRLVSGEMGIRPVGNVWRCKSCGGNYGDQQARAENEPTSWSYGGRHIAWPATRLCRPSFQRPAC